MQIDDLPGSVSLTEHEWACTAETEALIHKVDTFNKAVQGTGHAIGPCVLRLQAQLAQDISAPDLMVISHTRPIKKGTGLDRIPRKRKQWVDVRFDALRHAPIRMLAQLQIRFGTPTDMQLLAAASDPRCKYDLNDADLEGAFNLLFKSGLPAVRAQSDALLKAAMHVEYKLKHGPQFEEATKSKEATAQGAGKPDMSYLWASIKQLKPSAPIRARQSEADAVKEELKRWRSTSLVPDLIRAAKFTPKYDPGDQKHYTGVSHNAYCDDDSCMDECQIRMRRQALEMAVKQDLRDCLHKLDVAEYMSSPAYCDAFPLISSIGLRAGAVLPSCAIVESFFSITGYVDHARRHRQGEESREYEVILKHELKWLEMKRTAAAVESISKPRAGSTGTSTPASAERGTQQQLFFTPSPSSTAVGV